MTPDFVVSAEYFYALGVNLPPEVSAGERYRIATGQDERQVREELQRAVDTGVISGALPESPAQAARRLTALSALANTGSAVCRVGAGTPLQALVQAWLDFDAPTPAAEPADDIAVFWDAVSGTPTLATGHLDLVLCAITGDHAPLIAAIKAIPIATVDALAAQSAADWEALFYGPAPARAPLSDRLPAFTYPGTHDERVRAFIRHVRKFFAAAGATPVLDPINGQLPPVFSVPTSDPLARFADHFRTRAGATLLFGQDWDEDAFAAALVDTFPDDAKARVWLDTALRNIDELYRIADVGLPELRGALMEAMYARGFTGTASVQALSGEDFADALTGTPAHAHAAALYANAGGSLPPDGPRALGFRAINPYEPGSAEAALTSCVPSPQRSPLGPVAFLHEMLRVSEDSTCRAPLPDTGTDTLGAAIAGRRGDLGELAVTRANLETPLPAIDLVNESLEALAAGGPGAAGAVYDTPVDALAGHQMRAFGANADEPGAAPSDAGEPARHDAATLLAALPAHSSPATPVQAPGAYDALRGDVSAPALPYSQPVDIARSYLDHLGTDRFETMRRFRVAITEFALDPAAEPVEFQRHLWRYPVRIEIAREYLGLTAEEHALIFSGTIDEARLRALYGVSPAAGDTWPDDIARVSTFIERTGIDYRAFLSLWRSGFVGFRSADPGGEFADREPCDVATQTMVFEDPSDPRQALAQLAVFIRLWHKLRAVEGAGYRFDELRDICQVLGLFAGASAVNDDFVRQLAGFQMLRDDFALALAAPTTDDDPDDATGADRSHLLALWVGPAAPRWAWAVQHLLDQLQHHAQARYGCEARAPEFIRILAENLTPLSRLAGFDPDRPEATWHTRPTHTLRFAEVLAKIYASDFTVGELLFLFTADAHLDGDDPFALQPDNEAVADPLELPDDMVGVLPDDTTGDGVYSLWHLRRALLAVEVSDDEAASWTWPRIEAALRDDFGFEPAADPDSDPLLSLGRHFFPSVLAECGAAMSAATDLTARQYRVPLATTSPAMWNTPADGPFRYDTATAELWTALPLIDRDVLAKLARVKPLGADEQRAVRDLYFAPRVELARFALLFENFAHAARYLIEEPDEAARWAWFQRAFARCYARCQRIAEHLSGHVSAATGAAHGGDDHDHSDGVRRAWTLLRHLWADENAATAPWESDTGERPALTWGPAPSGGAFAALLGLTGTGLLGEISTLPADADAGDDGVLMWRELRGPMDAFGDAEDAWCAPAPTVVPAMGLALTAEQARFLGVRNGFAFAHADGAPMGGAEGVRVRWRGALLIEDGGLHGFWAEGADGVRWRVTLRRGHKRWVLLSRDWAGEDAPATGSAPMSLKRGAYELEVELEQPAPMPDGPEDLCARLAGFSLSYSGPDTGDEAQPLPFDRLFLDRKDQSLADGVASAVDGAARRFLEILYPSTLRDVRRTYQRAFKALLLMQRLGISGVSEADSGQSELGYMLDRADDFSGRAYYQSGPAYAVHQAQLDANLLPLRDNYYPPAAAADQRVAPSPQRQQALFDWWERLFDYTALRADAQLAPERPVWLLFHEAAENHADDPMHLLRHLGVDLHRAELVRQMFVAQDQAPYQVTSADLEDERWAVRVWRAESWLRALIAGLLPADIRFARPDLWASDDPGQMVNGAPPTGNENLTQFVRDGAFENGAPRRYDGVAKLNDGLRVRARAALLAYLCGMDRVPLPDGGFARVPRDLSELLLIDVEAGLDERKSRIEDAIASVQTFVQRYRLGLEPSLNASPELAQLWDRRFANLRAWERCKRRELYRENWIEWDELESARRTEGFRLLESELRRGSLAAPVPSTSLHWDQPQLPAHPGLTALQAREPTQATPLAPTQQGLALVGEPERHARPSWLAALPAGTPANSNQPAWVEAAVRLGTRFVRVAAAAPAPAAAAPVPYELASSRCCTDCGREHEPMVDEYYFWLIDSAHYTEVFQDADVVVSPSDPRPAWHQPETLPTLLAWDSEPMTHLMWCRLHDGELQPPRRSHEGVRISAGADPTLQFMGRMGDSLRFEVDGGVAPIGYAPTPPPGFRYDLAVDAVTVLPEVALPPVAPVFVGGLASYPHFAHVPPGAPLVPSRFSPSVTVAGALRTRCRFEEALAWYEQVFHPLREDAAWCPDDDDGLCDSVVSDEQARHRAVTLQYLETLLEWGDSILRAGTGEQTEKARLVIDTASRILGKRPRRVRVEDAIDAPTTVAAFAPAPAPLNPRLWALYERVDDRLALVHARLDAHRLTRARSRASAPDVLVASFYGDSGMRDGWQHTADVCQDEADWCLPPCPYRFMFLLQKAQELAGEVRGLGGALLSAYEKGDAEHLAALRQGHERQLLELALSIRKDQWRESDWQVQALRKTKEIAQTRRRYYQFLIDRGLITGEHLYLFFTSASFGLRVASQYPEGVARVLGLIPDVYVGPAPTQRIATGTKAADVVTTLARIMNILADAFSTSASVSLTKAGWDRREDEWRHQVEVLDIEIEQIERQILAAERRRDVALRELNNHQRQIENSIEVQDFLRDKFTNQELYVWLQKETAALHEQMYELALHAARQAERAFNLERGHTARRFLPDMIWDDLHEGLQAGERLQLALRQMEQAYLRENVREYELTKHISLRVHFPLAFLQLKLLGWCELEIPEWMYDLDYPGHYMRRIKNVSMSIPCVVGPYTGVHCRLTLLGSSTRVSPSLRDTGAGGDQSSEQGGYSALPDDSRIVTQYAASEAIATSSGQNDAGLFQLEFRDERYLPFEYAGAVSRWRIELPPENNYFDLSTLSDLVLHVGYMAREGGENLRRAAHEVAQQYLPDAGVRLFDVQHEMPNAWQRFQAAPGGYEGADKARALELQLGRNLFAFLPGDRDVTVTRLGLLFEVPGAEPSMHVPVELVTDPGASDCAVETIECVASEEWPGFYHGVIEVTVGPLGQGKPRALGTLRFPSGLQEIARLFLVCGYHAG